MARGWEKRRSQWCGSRRGCQGNKLMIRAATEELAWPGYGRRVWRCPAAAHVPRHPLLEGEELLSRSRSFASRLVPSRLVSALDIAMVDVRELAAWRLCARARACTRVRTAIARKPASAACVHPDSTGNTHAPAVHAHAVLRAGRGSRARTAVKSSRRLVPFPLLSISLPWYFLSSHPASLFLLFVCPSRFPLYRGLISLPSPPSHT